MNNLKIYQDSKELPFWNYKRIIQTGDFLYMIRNYESGDEVEADKTVLEEKFNEVVQDYVLSMNSKSEEVSDHGKFAASSNEINKLLIAVTVIELKQRTNTLSQQLNLPIDNSEIVELLQDIKVQKSADLEIQKQKILEKIEKYKNDLLQIQSKLEKIDNSNDEVDVDEQFISVCLGLETPIVDQKIISLYEYGVMIKILLKKIETLNKSRK